MTNERRVLAALSTILESGSFSRLNPRLVVLAVLEEKCHVADREFAHSSHESSALIPPPTFWCSSASIGGVLLEPGLIDNCFQRTIRIRLKIGCDV